MVETVSEVMTPDPIMLGDRNNLVDAARVMRDQNIGSVLVAREDGELLGIVTDRDLVVRGVAAGRPPDLTSIGEICSRHLMTIRPEDPVTAAVETMRAHTVRRLAVVDEAGTPIGVLCLGDLAQARDPDS